FQAEDGIRDFHVTGVQTCALPILAGPYLKGNLLSLAAAFSVALSFTLSERLVGSAMGVAAMAWAIVAGTLGLVPWTLPAAMAFEVGRASGRGTGSFWVVASG